MQKILPTTVCIITNKNDSIVLQLDWPVLENTCSEISNDRFIQQLQQGGPTPYKNMIALFGTSRTLPRRLKTIKPKELKFLPKLTDKCMS